MRVPNHAEGFGNQWGSPAWIGADDLSESFWVDCADEDVSFAADPLYILMSEEDAQ